MSVEENKAVVRRWIEALNTKNWAVLEELAAPDYIMHTAPPGTKQGWEGLREALIGLVNAFPDIQWSTEDIIAEGDKVVGRGTWSGTHRGEWRGIAPTNKRVTFGAIYIHQIVGGKLVGHWGIVDLLGVLQQLGAVTIKTAAK